MLFNNLSLPILLANAVALLVAITVHEFAHALVASRLGDPTAERLGRLSLNPLRHLDPIGTLMLLVAGFGWGKPVPVNPYYLRTGPKTGMALTSVAGPISNLITAFLFALPLRFDLVTRMGSPNGVSPSLFQILASIILLNIGLALFNLIPLPPLDGFSVALGLLPREIAAALAQIQPYGPFILLLLILAGRWLPFDPIGLVLGPAVNAILRLYGV
jgi:Zn-dependent protease